MNNGWIYSKSKTNFSTLYWVKGSFVINGEWHLKLIGNGEEAICPFEINGEPVKCYRIMPAPDGNDYQDILHEARNILNK